jgi:hypothetical protein
LPTRRELYQYINGDVSDEDEEDKSYLNTKRYFLKSKRYFLNSKRDNERQEVSDSFSIWFSLKKTWFLSDFCFFIGINAHGRLLRQYWLLCVIECNRKKMKYIINLLCCFSCERINKVTINIIPYVDYSWMFFTSIQYQIQKKTKTLMIQFL